ncbi:MucBP domain-containing protein [Leuconostoc falkenbergense]|uniref:MucBP domain-containing protein n=1 Tax=Leuconostoc falkenbergense TaxID=2766470 RepID=UPI0024AD3F2C|nr:MucBP domain-containing protein [Leuconostoc falkenbergense]MDI6666400.1 MucBP domain-containing protein [Leuconostoc falkenbergense]
MKTKSRAKLFLGVVVASLGLFVLGANSVSADSNQAVSQSQTSEKQMGTVIVQYVDQFGNQIYPYRVDKGEVGSPYHEQTAVPTFDNAEFLYSDTVNVPSVFTAQNQYLVFHYQSLLNAGKITVKYQDDDGKQLAPDRTIAGFIGQMFPYSQILPQSLNQSILSSGYYSEGIVPTGDTSDLTAVPRTVVVIFPLKNKDTNNTITNSSNQSAEPKATSQAKDVQSVQSESNKNSSAVLPNTNASKSSAATVPVLLATVMIIILTFGIRLAKNKK